MKRTGSLVDELAALLICLQRALCGGLTHIRVRDIGGRR